MHEWAGSVWHRAGHDVSDFESDYAAPEHRADDRVGDCDFSGADADSGIHAFVCS